MTSQGPRPTWVSRGTWLTGLSLHWPLALCIDHISVSAGNLSYWWQSREKKKLVQGRLWYFSSPSLRILSGWKCTPQEILSESQFMKSDILKLNLRILQSLRTGNLPICWGNSFVPLLRRRLMGNQLSSFWDVAAVQLSWVPISVLFLIFTKK